MVGATAGVVLRGKTAPPGTKGWIFVISSKNSAGAHRGSENNWHRLV